MLAQFRSSRPFIRAFVLVLIATCGQQALAQSDDPANGETDPIKLFERGQDAHAKGDTKLAIQLYEAAIKLRPEFPEAEFQRAMILVGTDRQTEAIDGFKRAVALRPDWAMAYSKFGVALSRPGSFDRDAEPILRRAIELDAQDLQATVALASIRQHAGDYKEAIKLISTATDLKSATAETWQRRAFIEAGNAGDDNTAALASITRAIQLEPENPSMRVDRARMLLLLRKDPVAALADLDKARNGLTLTSPNTQLGVIFEVARLYARAGKPEESLKLIDGLDEKIRTTATFAQLRAEVAADTDSNTPEDRAVLEQILQRDPQNASLLARLGNAYRRVDPAKSQDYYYRALQIEPKNEKYAVGYAAALVQSRQFVPAEKLLRQVISANPDNYTAHANLALALFEMKRFPDALPEYEWLATAKPDIAVTYFFIAIAHDNLGEYPQALDAYQKFLTRADPVNHKLEIEKVNLRLPTLREQIKRGEGVKRKGSD
jgi:tetratricopeptide (TPR) repeat protein